MSIMTKHQRFIETSMFEELQKAVVAISASKGEMEYYPLRDYYMQSMFLRLTGFQEQKLKCICWDIATYDYDYRRRLLNNEDRLGECSSLEAKSKLYKTILKKIAEFENKNLDNFKIDCYTDKKAIANNSQNELKNIFSKTIFQYWFPRDFQYFNNHTLFKPQNFANNGLLEENLTIIYDLLYAQRNRLAHNTLSYQENVPTLRTLSESKVERTNYFVWFALLNLIDKTFIELYRIYFEAFNRSQY